MPLFRWFTQNLADTSVPTHADLRPLTLPGTRSDAVSRIQSRLAVHKNWAVQSAGESDLHLTRKTGVLGYTDDVRLTLAESGGSVAVNARSRSRVGKGDLGQNRRNILELWRIVGEQRDQS